MPTCDNCGNEYDKTFTITRGDESGTFDSFECAIHAMAPFCVHCGCRILGSRVVNEAGIYCRAQCARPTRSTELTDRP